MNQLLQYAELAVLILTIASGLGGIIAYIWGIIDHGHPDVKREWFLRAVQLALAARGELETVLGSAAPVLEQQQLRSIASSVENYLAAHGLHVHVDNDTLKLILAELRQTKPT